MSTDLSNLEDEEILDSEKVVEYEEFSEELEFIKQNRDMIQELFVDTRDHLKTMIEASKRKGAGVSLGFIHAQTANLSNLMNTSIAANKAIIDTKQKRFANKLKTNPINKQESDEIPYALLKYIQENFSIDSGQNKHTERVINPEQDIDALLEDRITNEMSDELLDVTGGVPDKNVLEDDEETKTSEDSPEVDEDNLEVVVGMDGKLYIIDQFYKVYNDQYEIPETILDIHEDEFGELFAEDEGEKYRVIDTNFLEM